ncbi:permease prefix domain 1-containing protein [Brevibacillus humidisoli]|uniref:permease prefix domain 1-containing protein n=1 Tax=Brevibacillus humidisoli TaxID=2895522 RepID=UPI001E29527E|nr:permease prefix domain 1-containing protein [Brevibacillus humidisoli]UFJ41125.1 permease prefix domain 1-containing protein [Brevibacillus humidisoli]
MKELERFVEDLFANYRETREIQELKREILSNLEAKATDYIAEGIPYLEAVHRATRHMDTVDFLVEDHQPVYVNRYKTDLVQTALLYLLVGWILTIPIRMVSTGVWVNNLFTLAVALCTVAYFLLASKKDDHFRNAVSIIHPMKLAKRSKAAWVIWAMYVLMMTAYTAAIWFGSDLWFGRPISIDGPYQFAVAAVDFAAPFAAIVVPLLFQTAHRLASRYEVNV